MICLSTPYCKKQTIFQQVGQLRQIWGWVGFGKPLVANAVSKNYEVPPAIWVVGRSLKTFQKEPKTFDLIGYNDLSNWGRRDASRVTHGDQGIFDNLKEGMDIAQKNSSTWLSKIFGRSNTVWFLIWCGFVKYGRFIVFREGWRFRTLST